ncbi:unnamed protein product [Urochloa decumbens]|uniref:Dirigent protein n=1 Tax=Urochloa decumbens TaxID=240449 RepID=A0ABC9ANN8_9POAL
MAMVNPSYYRSGPSVRSPVQHQEHLFHLYAFELPNSNEHTIVQSNPLLLLPNHFGSTNVIDWDVRDAPDTNAPVVARLQGVGIASRKSTESWYTSFILVFTDQRFMGSTLSLQGPIGPMTVGDEGDWAVVGGAGEFVYAQGICSCKRIQAIAGGIINELRIRVVCLAFQSRQDPVKVGPWGGSGGAPYDISNADLPERLESLTVYANDDFVQTIAFSYIDQAGRRHNVGPWGGDAGKTKHPTIDFGPLETVKEIYGATGNFKGINVVTTLTIVTNVGKTYGPYGKQAAGNIPFHIAAPSNHSIVGFDGRVGEVLDQITAYVGQDY